jgi:hypothetical protein
LFVADIADAVRRLDRAASAGLATRRTGERERKLGKISRLLSAASMKSTIREPKSVVKSTRTPPRLIF